MYKTIFFALMFITGILSNAQTVADIDGNVYKTVKIGKQVWMAENLKSTKFSDGTDIPLVEKDTEWSELTNPGYCWYENDRTKFGSTYGILYNWNAVNTGKLCPDGWHTPNDKEWSVLSDFLGGNASSGKLKEVGQDHWEFPNTGATNESGFTALPSGRRNSGGNFSGIGQWGYFWTTTAAGTDRAWYRGIGNTETAIDRYSYSILSGFSVRCVKN